MWPGGSLEESTLTASRYMLLPSLTDGLFDTDGLKHEPPDLLDLDPDLLTTLNSPLGSIESCDSTSDDAVMLENWQMNEVFQEIPVQDVTTDLVPSLSEEVDGDLEYFVKHVLGDDNSTKELVTNPDTTKPSENTEFTTETIMPTDLDLKTVVEEAFGVDGLQGYDLLNELEAMDSSSVSAGESSADVVEVVDVADSSVVESDHQYTHLSNVKVKPHETKKQAIRRVKNNAASKVCRKQRKNRFSNNVQKIEELTRTNTELRSSIASIESVVDLLREHLVKATCKK